MLDRAKTKAAAVAARAVVAATQAYRKARDWLGY